MSPNTKGKFMWGASDVDWDDDDQDTVDKVGAKGYVHGWKFVGIPGADDVPSLFHEDTTAERHEKLTQQFAELDKVGPDARSKITNYTDLIDPSKDRAQRLNMMQRESAIREHQQQHGVPEFVNSGGASAHDRATVAQAFSSIHGPQKELEPFLSISDAGQHGVSYSHDSHTILVSPQSVSDPDLAAKLGFAYDEALGTQA